MSKQQRQYDDRRYDDRRGQKQGDEYYGAGEKRKGGDRRDRDRDRKRPFQEDGDQNLKAFEELKSHSHISQGERPKFINSKPKKVTQN